MKEITITLSLGRLAIAIVLATIVDAIVLAATSNGVMSIVLIPFLMFFFIYLICRKRISMLTRVLAALLAILVVALCIRFGKIAKPVLKQDIDTNASVTQEDKKEDQNDENSANGETEGQDNENEQEGGCNCNCDCGCGKCKCCGRK